MSEEVPCITYVVSNILENDTKKKGFRKEKRSLNNKQPVRVICYLCGRKAGTHSIRFHHEKCQQRRLDAGERLLIPPAPVLEDTLPTEAGEALDVYNSLATEVYERHAYIQCRWCKRHLLRTDRAQRIHNRECLGLIVPGSRRDVNSSSRQKRREYNIQ